MFGRNQEDMAREHELASMNWRQRLADEYAQGGNPDISRCPCHGSGWIVSPVETVTRCPYHHRGQPHPEEDHVTEMLSFSLKEYELTSKEGGSVTFQVMEGRLVNVYHSESGEALAVQVSTKEARGLWRNYHVDGYSQTQR